MTNETRVKPVPGTDALQAGFHRISTASTVRAHELGAVFDAVVDGLVINTVDGEVVEANQAICKMHGYTYEEFIGLDPRTLIHPEDFHLFGQYIKTVMAGEPFRCTARDLRKDGTEFEVEVHGSLISFRGKPHILGVVRDISHQTKVEADLQQSQVLYSDLFEHAPDMIASIDAVFASVTECNETLANNLGYHKNEILGRSIFELYDPSSIEDAKTAFRTLYEQDKVEGVELLLRAKDGRQIEVSLNGSAVRDQYGNVLRTRSIWRDISDRKRAEARQAESENLFHTIFRSEPECVKLLDRQCNLLDMNPAGLEMVEVPSIEDVRGKSILQVILPMYHTQFLQAAEEVFRGESRSLQFEIVGAKGTRRWMESHQVPLRDTQGSITSLLAVTQDISARKRSELLLTSRNEVLEKLATGASLTEVLTILVNAAEQVRPGLFGSVLLLDDEGKHLLLGAAPNLPDFFSEAIDGVAIGPKVGSCGTAASTGKRIIVEDVMNHPFWSDFLGLAEKAGLRACWSEPILGSRGDILGTFALYYREPRGPEQVDLDLIRGSAHLAAIAIENRRAHDELERLVRQRTEELASANEALTQSNLDLQDFAYVASHDLQEPLRMVTSYCQLLQRRYQNKLDSDADEFIEFAVDGATRMQTLIQDLLMYSRVQTQGQPFTPIDTAILMEDVVLNLQTRIESTGATVTYNAMPTVMADRSQLFQILQNLVDNGIKYHSLQPPTVHVTARREGDQWLFEVRDNGIGIEPKYQEQVFTVFKRLHGRDQYEGTGIGLAICRRAIMRHGGRIWCESPVEGGTIFSFTIPVEQGPLK